MSLRASRKPAGFVALGTHRNLVSGSLRWQRGNPWGNPCPDCGAARYERCFKVTGIDPETSKLPDAKSYTKFLYIKDKPCGRRVTWYSTEQDEQPEHEGDDE